MMRVAVVVWLLFVCSSAACSNKPSETGAPASAPSGSYLTVGKYCDGFCDKLCATCGMGECANACRRRCHYGRSPDQLLDGKDPKVALALTQSNLDACLATINSKDSCLSIASGNVPPACYTIQH